MNGIKHPASPDFNLIIETDCDRVACRRALGLGGVGYETVLAIDRMAVPSVLETEVTETVAQNLARISLGKHGERGFSGLTQAEAAQKLKELSGDIEAFFSTGAHS